MEEVFLKFDDLRPREAGGSPEDDPSAADEDEDGASSFNSSVSSSPPLFFFSLHGFNFVDKSTNNFPETEIKMRKKKTK